MAASLNGNNKMFLFSLTVLSSWVLITGSIPSVVTDFPLFEITKEFDDIITFNDHAILKFQEQEPMENLTCASCEGSSERECTLNQTAVVCDQDPDAACLTFEAFNNFTMTTTFRRGCFLTGIFCDNACRSFNVSQDGNLTSCVQDCCNSSLCNAGSLPTEVTTEASTTAKETTAASTTAKQTETTASSTTAKQTTEASTTAKQTTAPSTTTKQTTAISTTAVTTKPTTTKQTTTTTAPTTAPTTIPTPIACGGVLRTRGTFTSPGFPGNYPNNVRCEWRVFLPRGRRGVFRIVSLVLADSGDSLEFFDSGRVVRSFRGPTRRTRSLSHDQTTNEKVLGEGEDGYYDDQEYVDYYYYDRRRKREPYFYQRRKKRRQQMVGLVVIQGRNQVVSSIFQSDAAGNAAGFSAGFVQGRTDTETDTSASSESSDED